MARTLRTLLASLVLGAVLSPAIVPRRRRPRRGRRAAPQTAGAVAAAPFDARRPLASADQLAAAEVRARAELGRSTRAGRLRPRPPDGDRAGAGPAGRVPHTAPSDAGAADRDGLRPAAPRAPSAWTRRDLATFVPVREFDGPRRNAPPLVGPAGGRRRGVRHRAQGLGDGGRPHRRRSAARRRTAWDAGSTPHAARRRGERGRRRRPGRAGRRRDDAADATRARIVWFHGARSTLAWRTLTYVSRDASRPFGRGRHDRRGALAGERRGERPDRDRRSRGSPTRAPRVPNGGGTQQEVTFPVKGIGRLAGNNAHVYLDVNDDNRAGLADEIAGRRRSGLERRPPTSTPRSDTQNCKPVHACTWNRARGAVVEGEPRPERRADLLLPEQVPRPPARRADRVHRRRRQLPGARTPRATARSATRSRPRCSTAPRSERGLPDRFHYNNANMFTRARTASPRDHADVPVPRGPVRAWLAVGQRRRRRRDRLPRVHARPVEPARHLSERAPAPQRCSSAGAMGEAWSDWYAMDLLVDEGWEPDTNAPGRGASAAEYITGGVGDPLPGDRLPGRAPASGVPAGLRTVAGRVHLRRLRRRVGRPRGPQRRRDLGADALGPPRARSA